MEWVERTALDWTVVSGGKCDRLVHSRENQEGRWEHHGDRASLSPLLSAIPPKHLGSPHPPSIGIGLMLLVIGHWSFVKGQGTNNKGLGTREKQQMTNLRKILS